MNYRAGPELVFMAGLLSSTASAAKWSATVLSPNRDSRSIPLQIGGPAQELPLGMKEWSCLAMLEGRDRTSGKSKYRDEVAAVVCSKALNGKEPTIAVSGNCSEDAKTHKLSVKMPLIFHLSKVPNEASTQVTVSCD